MGDDEGKNYPYLYFVGSVDCRCCDALAYHRGGRSRCDAILFYCLHEARGETRGIIIGFVGAAPCAVFLFAWIAPTIPRVAGSLSP